MGFFSRLFGKNKVKDDPQPRDVEGGIGILTIDTDNLTREGREAIWEEIGKTSNIPIYEGKVEHGYSRLVVPETGQCPRCHAQTQQHYANFIYATDTAPRVMFVPAGFFCTACPTVVIDEKLISTGVKEGFRFQGVVGIDYDRKKEPDLFRTWNGKRAVYVFDEDKNLKGMSAIDDREPYRGASQPLAKNREKLKKKRQMAKKARKRNRRA